MAFVETFDGGETFLRGTDAKQLKLLKKGVEYWNDWIEESEVSVNLYKRIFEEEPEGRLSFECRLGNGQIRPRRSFLCAPLRCRT
jgi:hypothetical protein